ncbi:hypothetical protein C0Z16_28945 [Paraburkholderia rhynchosiae]|uniref:Uncharacterized protein n=1 Tax=Paraburkholderia rhynchosiae TaxID=487049 RepID=A0ABX4V0B4_9BURK|nr:hypothetical protein C0Z16_28945 [Paraburkholderia rhynchosiae]
MERFLWTCLARGVTHALAAWISGTSDERPARSSVAEGWPPAILSELYDAMVTLADRDPLIHSAGFAY